jgi:hypothetical protein
MMVGYCPDHGVGTYRMFGPNTNGIHLSRDVTWLRRKFYPSLLATGEGEAHTPVTETPAAAPTAVSRETEPDDEEETKNGEDEKEEEQTEVEQVETVAAGASTMATTRSGRAVKLPMYLRDDYETSHVSVDYNIELTQAEERYYQAMSEFGFSCIDHDGVEMAMVGAGVGR